MASLTPVDYDPFAQPFAQQPPDVQGDSDRAPLRITIHPESAGPKLTPVDHNPFESPSTMGDVARAIPSGLVKGAIGLAAIPDTIGKLWFQGGYAILNQMEHFFGLPKGWADDTRSLIENARSYSPMSKAPTADEMRSGVESVTGPLYEPQTTPGKYAETMAEFVPGAGRRVLSMAALPGAVSETAGQLTQGKSYEPAARIAGAVVGGAAGGASARAGTPQAAIRQNMAPHVDDATIQRASNLMRDAQSRGVTLTWPEAIEQVAPGSGLPNVQRLLESSSDTRGRMGQFFADRPAQLDRAAGQTFDEITPAAPNPSAIGPIVGRAAEETINDTRGAINNAAEPFYTRASTVRLTPQEMQQVRALPGYQEARDAIRNTPQLNRYVAHLPDDSVGFLNEVKKQLDASAQGARSPLNQNPNMQIPAGYSRDAETVRNIGQNASPDYEIALSVERQAREKYLQPLLDGPLGKIATKDVTTQKAIDALFPKNPLPNSSQEIATTVSALAKKNQYAARNLVRAHAESVFNESVRSTQAGSNQFGGANFAKNIAGNPQQKANLEAAVRSLGADGDDVWKGFDKLLEIAEATGKRERIGSKTAFNAKELQDLSTGGAVANIAKTGASPSKWLNVISDAWSRWQLGNNLNELASILTDPKLGRMLKAIAREPVGSEKAQILAANLIRLSNAAGDSRSEPPKEAKRR